MSGRRNRQFKFYPHGQLDFVVSGCEQSPLLAEGGNLLRLSFSEQLYIDAVASQGARNRAGKVCCDESRQKTLVRF